MKRGIIVMLIALWLGGSLYAQQSLSMNREVKFRSAKLSVLDLAESLQRQDIPLAYSREVLSKKGYVQLPDARMSLGELLSFLQKNKQVSSRIQGNTILLADKIKQEERKKKADSGRVIFSGMIVDAESGESLIGASVYVKELKTGASSNYYGRFALPLEAGNYHIQVSYIGYEAKQLELNLNKNTTLTIRLKPSAQSLNEIEISAEREGKLLATSDGHGAKLTSQSIRQIPTVLGDPDVMQSIQMLPGVNSAHEGTTNLSVRGGSFDQNLILLDEASIYNPAHTLGLYSVINTDAVKNVEFYKGYIPARYGGRLSSVVDVRMREGNKQKYGVDATIGLLSSRLAVEGPIKKDESSFMITGRYSYVGDVANLLAELGNKMEMSSLTENFESGNDVNFYDLNAKFNFKINDKNHLYLSAYTGRDKFYYSALDDDMSMEWGNSTGTLRWNQVLAENLFANYSFVYSQYKYSYYLLDDSRYYEWAAGLKEYKGKLDFDWAISSRHSSKFGTEFEYLNFDPGSVDPRTSQSNTISVNLPENKALLWAAYYEHDWKINDMFGLQAGLRFSGMKNEGVKSSDKVNYMFLEPRVALNTTLSPDDRISLSYGRTAQYMHLISNSSLGLPTDVWMTASKNVKPQTADQISLGYTHEFKDTPYSIELQGYYKKLYDVVDFKDNADFFLNENIENEILGGEATAYGLELLAKKQYGKLQGWLSYTWSKADRNIDGINNGEVYPARYDRRHNLKFNTSYKLTDHWTLSTNFAYATGAPITVPVGKFSYHDGSFTQYSKRNEYRLPDFHRLDFLITYKKESKKGVLQEWNIGLYNAYGRKNVFSLYTKPDAYNLDVQQAKKIYLFTYVPTISYRIKF